MKKCIVERIIPNVAKLSPQAYKITADVSDGFPANQITEVRRKIDPMTAEG